MFFHGLTAAFGGFIANEAIMIFILISLSDLKDHDG